MKRQVNICMTINLRDFAAFEDLALELGYVIELQNIVPQEKPKPRTFSSRHQVNLDLIRQVKAVISQHPELSSKEIISHLGIPHSESTISRIRLGRFDHLLKTNGKGA